MSTTAPKFFGGKMFHCFKSIPGENKFDPLRYIPEATSDDVLEILRNGKWYVKIDGSNGLLVRTPNGTYNIYRRYDDKKGNVDPNNLPPHLIRLPAGKNTDLYTSPDGNEHRYYQSLQPRPAPGARGKEADLWRKMYAILDASTLTEDFYSVELVGKNFSGTPGVMYPTIALHSAQITESVELNTIEAYFAFFKNYFRSNIEEGIVVEYNGQWWKILAEQFEGSRWSTDRAFASPPVTL